MAAVNRAVALPEIFEAALNAVCRCQHTTRSAILLADPEGVSQVATRGEPDPLAHPGARRAPDTAVGRDQVPGTADRQLGRGRLAARGDIVNQQLERS